MIKGINDTELIYQLLKILGEELGIPYKDDIIQKVKQHRFYAFWVDNQLAGLCSYTIHKQKRTINIEDLVSFPQFEGLNVKLQLILHIYQQVESLIKTLDYKLVITSRVGLKSNDLYNSISKMVIQNYSKTGKTELLNFVLSTSTLDHMTDYFIHN